MMNAIKTKASQMFPSVLPLGSLRKRDDGEEALAGVCAGIAYWLGAPEWCVRVAVIGLGLFSAVAIVGYIIMAVAMPDWETLPANFDARIGRSD